MLGQILDFYIKWKQDEIEKYFPTFTQTTERGSSVFDLILLKKKGEVLNSPYRVSNF